MEVFLDKTVLGQRWECFGQISLRTEMGVFLDKTVLGLRWECFRTEMECFWTKQS